MREIKFRGKRIDNGEWVYGNYEFNFSTVLGRADYRINEQFTSRTIRVYPETLGQFTGLEDMHGNEIFEGDILRNVLNQFVDNEPFEVFFSIDWSGWHWKNANDNKDCFYDSIALNCEVIGNIHDNPKPMEVRID